MYLEEEVADIRDKVYALANGVYGFSIGDEVEVFSDELGRWASGIIMGMDLSDLDYPYQVKVGDSDWHDWVGPNKVRNQVDDELGSVVSRLGNLEKQMSRIETALGNLQRPVE